MAEHDLEQPQVATEGFASVGTRLRHGRERLGLSRADVAGRTKIAERHLAALEDGRYADLASSTYAVGFSRAYARAVGLDEREIAQAMRNELNLGEEANARPMPTFEPGDPARVPSSRTAWLAGAGVIAVIACVVIFWGSYYFPAVSLPDLTRDTPPAPSKAAPPTAPAPLSQGPVVVTATENGVWVKVFDAAGKQLFQKQMAQGESYTIPPDAAGPQLRTAWPDALAVTIGGRPVAPLSDKRQVITAPVSASALLARGAPAPAAAPAVQPSQPAAAPAPRAAEPVRAAAPPRPRPSPAPAAAAAAPAANPAPPAPAAEPAPAAPPPPAAAPAAEAPKASTVSQ